MAYHNKSREVISFCRQQEPGRQQRETLIQNLFVSDHFSTRHKAEVVPGFAYKQVLVTCPTRQVTGLVIHERLMAEDLTPFDSTSASNICFLCTVLGALGDTLDGYENCVFSLSAVSKFLSKHTIKGTIINQMKIQTRRPTAVTVPRQGHYDGISNANI